MRSVLKGFAALSVAALLAACGETEETGPYATIVGGSFVVNYAQGGGLSYYGFKIKLNRKLPPDAIVEASLEMPGGAPALVERQRVTPGQELYVFKTPPLQGIVANHPYKAEYRILEADARRVIETASATYKTIYDDAWLKK